jgi:5-methylcytosine-specific restriction endonuclease McrA
MRSTLLLNASYEPLSVVSAQRAVTLVIQGKATVEDASPYFFHASGGLQIEIPYVARLTKEVKRGRNARAPRFSRRGVLIRDNFTCAYCGNYGDTIDHVLPRARGGLSTFDNCVTACKRCNHKKSDKTLAQMGWTIKTKLTHPSPYSNMLNKVRNNDELFDSWIEYISWYDEGAKAEKAKRKELLTEAN